MSDTIIKDSLQFVAHLPDKEKSYIDAGMFEYFTNSLGGKAFRIDIPVNGKWNDHVLIYDTNSVRIRTITYSKGRYSS